MSWLLSPHGSCTIHQNEFIILIHLLFYVVLKKAPCYRQVPVNRQLPWDY